MISHAAIRIKEPPYTVFTGKHHADCYKKYNTINPKVEQGFVTDKGEFVSRSKAAGIAFDCGQIDHIPSVLFSEDFWSVVYNGKYDYDEQKGYILKAVLTQPE